MRKLELQIYKSWIKIPIAFLIPVVSLITLLVGIYFFVNSAAGVRIGEKIASSILPSSYHVGKLLISPSFSEIHLFDVEILDPEEKDFIYVRQLDVTLNPLLLLAKRLYIVRATLHEPRYYQRYDEKGRLNVLTSFGVGESDETEEDEGSGTPFLLTIKDVELINGYTFLDFDFMTIEVDGIKGRNIDLSTGESLSIDVPTLKADSGNVHFKSSLFRFPEDYPDLDIKINSFDIQNWSWLGDGFSFKYLKFLSNGVTGELYGKMGFPSQPGAFTYAGAGNVWVAPWAYVPQYFIRDHVHANGLIRASVAGAQDWIKGKAIVDASFIEVAKITGSNLKAEVDLNDSYLLMRQGEVDLHGGKLDLKNAYYDMFQSKYGGTASFKRINPYGVLKDLGFSYPWLKGRASGKIFVRGEVPIDPEIRVEDPMQVVDSVRSHVVDVEVIDTINFSRSNQELLPGSYFDLASGTTFWTRTDRMGVPKGLARSDAGTFKIKNFGFNWDHYEFQPSDSAQGDANVVVTSENVANLTKYYGFSGISGKFFANMSFQGRANYPDLKLEAKIDNPVIAGAEHLGEVHDLSTRLLLKNGTLQVEEAAIKSDFANVDLKGKMQLLQDPDDVIDAETHLPTTDFLIPKNPNISATYTLDKVDLSLLSKPLGLPIKGVANLTGTLSHTLKQPNGGVDAQVKNLIVDGQAIDSVDTKLVLKERTLSIEKLNIDGVAGGKVTTTGDITLQKNTFTPKELNLQVSIADVDLEKVKALKNQPLKGVANTELTITGSPSDPFIDGNLIVDGLFYDTYDLGNLVTVLNTIDGMLYVTGSLLPWFTIQAEYPLKASESMMYGRLGFTNFDIKSFLHLDIDNNILNRFSTTGTIELFAEKNLSDYQLVLTIPSLQFDTLNHSFENEGAISIGFNSDRVVQVGNLGLKSDEHAFKVIGALSLDDRLIDMKLQGDLELSLLGRARAIFPSIFPESIRDINGSASMDLQLRGFPEDLTLDGFLKFNKSEVLLREFPDPVILDSGVVRFLPHKIYILPDEALKGRALTGSYSVYGDLLLNGFAPKTIDLHAQAYNISYQIPELLQMNFDADINFQAQDFDDAATWKMGGDIEIISGVYSQKVSLLRRALTDPLLGALDRKTQRYEASIFDYMPQLRDMQLGLTIKARDGLRLKNTIDKLLLDLELRLNLDLSNTLVDPKVVGAIDVLNGTVNVQDEDFTIRTGTVTFFGNPYNPMLDIQADADVRNRCAQSQNYNESYSSLSLKGIIRSGEQQLYRIVLYLQGYLDNLDFEFDSNPSADKRDILSLLLTGCTIDQLTTPSNSSAQTLQLALGPLLNWIESRVQSAIQIEEFTISPSVDRLMAIIGDSYSPRLSWRVFLDTGFNNADAGQRAQLRYLLSDDWSLEASEHARTEEGTPALDLKFIFTRDFD